MIFFKLMMHVKLTMYSQVLTKFNPLYLPFPEKSNNSSWELELDKLASNIP